tara:strand:+ start:578 stop:1048 length:471 start_codon:yes stop_codon:yes gene_type:complete
MLNKFIKICTILSLFFIFQGCGYQPLLSEKYKKFSVNNFNIEGDRKLGQSLANNFSKIENAENNLFFIINAKKEKKVSNRSLAGKPLAYNVLINFNLIAKTESSNLEVLNQNFSQSGTFKASKLHIDTINKEKKIVDNIVKNIAERISNRLNLIYK